MDVAGGVSLDGRGSRYPGQLFGEDENDCVPHDFIFPLLTLWQCHWQILLGHGTFLRRRVS